MLLFFSSFAGFRDALSMKNFNESDAEYAQEYVRKRLTKQLAVWNIKESEYVHFFDQFYQNIEEFEFLYAEIKALKEIGSWVKIIADGIHGFRYFSIETNASIITNQTLLPYYESDQSLSVLVCKAVKNMKNIK